MTTTNNSAIRNTVVTLANGAELAVREYEGGIYSFGKAQRNPLNRVHLNTFGKIFGFFNALKQMKTNGNGFYTRGWHQHVSNDFIADLWESTKGKDNGELVYVNFRELRNPELVALLSDLGIEKQDNHWLTLYGDRQGLHPYYRVTPMTSDEFRKSKNGEPTDLDWEEYKKAWAQQNKHDGMELVLRALDGDTAVICQYKPSEDTTDDGAFRNRTTLANVFGELIDMTAEELRGLAAQRAANRTAYRSIKAHAWAMNNNPAFELSTEAQEAKDSGTINLFMGGELVAVDASELIGQRIQYVHDNGMRALPGTVKVSNEIVMTCVIDKCAKMGLNVALSE
jgi:hypothetical protein